MSQFLKGMGEVCLAMVILVIALFVPAVMIDSSIVAVYVTGIVLMAAEVLGSVFFLGMLLSAIRGR